MKFEKMLSIGKITHIILINLRKESYLDMTYHKNYLETMNKNGPYMFTLFGVSGTDIDMVIIN